MELVSTLAKNATKPNHFEIILLQTTRKENNWKTEESNCNFGDRTDQRVQSLMFMMMMTVWNSVAAVINQIMGITWNRLLKITS